MNVRDIVSEVLAGNLDDDLRYLSGVIRDRKDMLTQRVAASLRPGDSIKITNISPKYMIGATAKIIRVNRKRAVVELDNPTGRFMGEITVPLACMQKI